MRLGSECLYPVTHPDSLKITFYYPRGNNSILQEAFSIYAKRHTPHICIDRTVYCIPTGLVRAAQLKTVGKQSKNGVVRRILSTCEEEKKKKKQENKSLVTSMEKTCFCHMQPVCHKQLVTAHFNHVILWTLRQKLSDALTMAIAWDFSSPHLSAQIPPLEQ